MNFIARHASLSPSPRELRDAARSEGTQNNLSLGVEWCSPWRVSTLASRVQPG
ncbi:hypothetical protein MTR_8g016410 [Medicago truncatula]|uniref:Uncharacterized protein n=1 Tax=Medicago truncatula TaxID=3880 RepID=A0A072TNI3_MEDTR|nr:hypothetical protein MTR_8g016410 [Medicago truncatula]